MNQAKKRKKPEIEEELEPHPCSVAGCKEMAYYKAPKSVSHLNEHFWFCLEHVREYNQKWDYFVGMSAEEIDEFRKDAMFGHRPTWKVGSQIGHNPHALEEALASMFDRKPSQVKQRKVENGVYVHLTRKDTRAIASLDLDDLPASLAELKKHYKTLVKRYHPDVNKGDKASEERFKAIASAYKHLEKLLQSVRA